MHHIAIMKKSWGLIPKIISGEKTIESRWYKTRRAPWNKVKAGDTIFFKDSGEPVIAKAEVLEVFQIEIENINIAKQIVEQNGREICIVNPNVETWKSIPRYVILMRITNPASIPIPFEIKKDGFGSGSAWMVLENIDSVRA